MLFLQSCVLLFLVCGSACPPMASAQADATVTAQLGASTGASLRATVEAITQEPTVARAHWGVSVAALDGTPLLALNDGQYFQPASNAKLFTTAAAMALLPMDERLHTQVIASGYFQPGGVYEGDLRIRGVGDANLSGRPIPYAPPVPNQPAPPRDELRYFDELAGQIKAAGIQEVRGNIIGDDSLFPYDPYPSDWSIDDAPWYYGAPITAIMVADNAIALIITPSKSGGAPTVATDPALPYYRFNIQASTGPAGTETALDIQREIGSRDVRIYGSIAADAKPYKQDISIDDPDVYAALALKAALAARGVSVSGDAESQRTPLVQPSFNKQAALPLGSLALGGPRDVLLRSSLASCNECSDTWHSRVVAEHVSTPIVDDIAVTNKTSENQHAELWLRQLGFHIGGPATTAQGARVVRAFLTTRAGIDPQDFVFVDGSGLSGHDLVTPRSITRLLSYATTQPWGEKWKASFPIGGVDGSLRSRFAAAPLKGHVFAKTGTLGEARALGGYVDCASGRTVAFSVMVSTHTPLDNDDQKAMDRIVAAIAAAN